MSRKFQIVLSDPLATQLHEIAAAAGEPASTVAGQMVRNGIAHAAKDGRVRPLRASPIAVSHNEDRRARWLEPYGGNPDWSLEMWGGIVALHGRYPRHLEALKDEWWSDEAHTEMLCALAVWRGEIDDAGLDPREEIAFQTQMADYAALLRQHSGGVTRAWKPGAPPAGWAGK